MYPVEGTGVLRLNFINKNREYTISSLTNVLYLYKFKKQINNRMEEKARLLFAKVVNYLHIQKMVTHILLSQERMDCII